MTASLPLFITNKMRADLAGLGFTPEQIKNMTPAEAWEKLGGMPAESQPVEVQPAQPDSGSNIDTFSAHVLAKLINNKDRAADEAIKKYKDKLPERESAWADAILATPHILPERRRAFQAAIAGLAEQSEIESAVWIANHQADLATIPQPITFQKVTRPRIVRRTAADALQPQPPIDWVIEKLFSAGSLSVLVGAPGTKKTYSLLSAAVCVALGKPWLNFPTKQGKALIIDEESGERRLARRLGEVLRGENGGADTPIEYVSLARFNIRDKADQVLFQALIEEVGASLVIIDALADIMPGADENTVKDVQPVFMALRDIAIATNTAMVLIHHANKMGGYRGSSAINGAVDFMLMTESKQGSPIIEFSSEKPRDTGLVKFTAMAHFEQGYLDPDTFLYTDPAFRMTPSDQTQPKPRHYNKAESYVLRYLEERKDGALLTEIMDHADTCPRNSARAAVYRLVDENIIYRCDSGGSGSKASYKLAGGGAADSSIKAKQKEQLGLEESEGIDLES